MGIETAIIGSALIGGASSLLGGKQAADGAKAGAKASKQQFAKTEKALQPYMTAGENSLAEYLTSIGLHGGTDEERKANQQQFFDDFQYDPGFQSFLDRTTDNTMRAYSLFGDTGGNLANAMRERSGEAIYGQFQDRRAQLGGLADSGRAAATALGSIGQANSATQAGLLSQAGQHMGAGIAGAGQAAVNAFGQFGKLGGGQAGYGGSPWTTQTVNRVA